ncbi:MAG: DUF2147 domain-containing protein [Chitinophagaceae bacterium]
MKVLFILMSLLFATKDNPIGNSDAIVGVWQNGTGKGHIQIFKQDGKYHGKIIWLREPLDKQTGRPKVDTKNPIPSNRNNPILGLVMMRNFRYDEGEWNGGQIYVPSEGKEYKAYIKMVDENTLSVRGYIGIALIGKTDTWTRVGCSPFIFISSLKIPVINLH